MACSRATFTLLCGPGQLSRYSNSLLAGRSGDRIPLEARFFAPVQTVLGAHPASYTMGTGSFFPVVKRAGRGVDDSPPHLRPKEDSNYTSAPPLGLRGLFWGDLYPYLILFPSDAVVSECYTGCHANVINRLTPNDPYMGRTTPQNSKLCILYIYSTNIGTEYFKHSLYSPFFLFKMLFVS